MLNDALDEIVICDVVLLAKGVDGIFFVVNGDSSLNHLVVLDGKVVFGDIFPRSEEADGCEFV